jgi:4-hydroxythreonine-4-phosphate dehydrogenase
MAAQTKPIVAVTLGDPCGIGPEIVAKALLDPRVHNVCQPLVIGNTMVFEEALDLIQSPLKLLEVTSPQEIKNAPGYISILDSHNLSTEHVIHGQISPEAGRACMEWVIQATELCQNGDAIAIATAPINKEAAHAGGFKDVGHMEVLQRLSGVDQVATMLVSGRLRVVHLTTHRSVKQACDYVTKENVVAKLELTHQFFQAMGFNKPRIGVAALNPHAGENGMLGHEETTQLIPAVQEACQRGINATGPIPADTIFLQAIKGQYDAVLCMYHDQGHIAVKLHGFEQSYSVTMGIPFIRTSVDHGTAFDIAGKGLADARSMARSIRMAAMLSRGKGLR